MGMDVSDFDLLSGMMSFCALNIRGVVDMVCHSGINGCNSYMQSLSIVGYFCDGGDSLCCDLEWPLCGLC